jgi:hypothetical protein
MPGAVSPATARPLAEIAGATPDVVLPLAMRGVIRQASAGLYYLHAGTEHARRQRIVWAAVVVVLVVIPILLVLFRGH